jgi:hypothetical protein
MASALDVNSATSYSTLALMWKSNFLSARPTCSCETVWHGGVVPAQPERGTWSGTPGQRAGGSAQTIALHSPVTSSVLLYTDGGIQNIQRHHRLEHTMHPHSHDVLKLDGGVDGDALFHQWSWAPSRFHWNSKLGELVWTQQRCSTAPASWVCCNSWPVPHEPHTQASRKAVHPGPCNPRPTRIPQGRLPGSPCCLA